MIKNNRPAAAVDAWGDGTGEGALFFAGASARKM